MHDGSAKIIQTVRGELTMNALAALLAHHVQFAIGLIENIRRECQ